MKKVSVNVFFKVSFKLHFPPSPVQMTTNLQYLKYTIFIFIPLSVHDFEMLTILTVKINS